MSYAVDMHSELYEAGTKGLKDGTISKAIQYSEALHRIRKILTDDHATELRASVESESAAQNIKALIAKYVRKNHMSVSGVESLSDLVDRLYDDMLGFSLLTVYIYDPSVEEINVNRWDDIEILYAGGRYVKLKEKFPSPMHCSDLAKRMALLGNVVVDAAKPVADSFITRGVRIHVELPPVIDPDAGAAFSIRKQSSKNFTREDYLRSGTATEEILDFVQLAANHGISIGIAGPTYSGKTTDVNYVVNGIPFSKRIFCVEEDSRELNFVKRDAEDKVISRVIHTKTRRSDDVKLDVDPSVLARAALRVHPDIVVMAEMRGKEAIVVQEAGRTGQQIFTTFHADSAYDAYTRYQSMCVSAQSGFTPDQLLEFCYQSIPIMCFKEILEDGRRKFTQIVEAVKTGDGYKIVPIFEYIVTGHERDKKGLVTKTIGVDRQINFISDALAYRMLKRGADLKELRRFARPDYDPKDDKLLQRGDDLTELRSLEPELKEELKKGGC